MEYEKPPQGILNYNPGLKAEFLEKVLILHHMDHFKNHKLQVAVACGFSLSTLERKLEQYKDEQINEELKRKRITEQQEETQRRLRGLPPGTNVREGFTFQAGQGLQFQPAPQAPKEQPLPLPVREEVQKVLPAETSKRGRGRPRKDVPSANEAVRRELGIQDERKRA